MAYEKSEEKLEIENRRVFSKEKTLAGEEFLRVKVTISFAGCDSVHAKNFADALLVEVNGCYNEIFSAIRRNFEKEVEQSKKNAQ